MARIVRRTPEASGPSAEDVSLMNCDVSGCIEFAQTRDRACENMLKFKCEKHEKEALARGQTGKRREWKSSIEYGIGTADDADRQARTAVIHESLAAGVIPPPKKTRGLNLQINPDPPAPPPPPPAPIAAPVMNETPAPPAEKKPITPIERNPMAKGRQPRKVKCLDDGKVYDSARAAAEDVGVSPSLINAAINGRVGTAGGKKWGWSDDGAAATKPAKVIKQGKAPRPSLPAAAVPPRRGKPSDVLKQVNGNPGIIELLDQEILELEGQLSKRKQARAILAGEGNS